MTKGGIIMPVKITTESAADLSGETASEFGIGVIPMNIILDGKVYKDGVTIKVERLLESGLMATTSAVNVEEYKEFFSEVRGNGFDIIHISLGGKLSSSYQNAVTASAMFDNVRVIDSGNLSAGTGLLCVTGSQLASASDNASGIVRILEKKKDSVRTSFILEDLERMKRGGRCTAIEALGANLLGIKPSIEVRDGRLVPSRRYHGRGSSARLKYIDKMIRTDDPDRSVCFFNHTLESSNEVSEIEGMLKERYGFERVFVNKVGCCISAHCGVNCMGVIYFSG